MKDDSSPTSVSAETRDYYMTDKVTPLHKSRRVLLVDDERDYVQILAKRLRRRGFQVSTAFNGSDGIQAMRKNDFDVAVVDLKMVDIDGIEVLKIFKRMAPEVAVIMLTGHGSTQAATEGLQLGAADYLSKPCELNELVHKIELACQSSPSP